MNIEWEEGFLTYPDSVHNATDILIAGSFVTIARSAQLDWVGTRNLF